MTQLIVEKQRLLESIENDAEFLKTVIALFFVECPKMLAEIRAAVARRDFIQVMSASHGLKGSVSFFRAKVAIEAARILESMGEQRTLEGLDEAFCVLDREIALVVLALVEIANEAVY